MPPGARQAARPTALDVVVPLVLVVVRVPRAARERAQHGGEQRATVPKGAPRARLRKS